MLCPRCSVCVLVMNEHVSVERSDRVGKKVGTKIAGDASHTN